MRARLAATALLLLAILGGERSAAASAESWRFAESPWSWSFPRDHGNHPDFQIEWWYLTGNLSSPSGSPYGFEITLFRRGLFHTPPQRESRWKMRDVFFGHFAISDIRAKEFFFAERADRGALGEAGSAEKTMEVWVGDWRIEAQPDGSLRAQAAEKGRKLALSLHPCKPPVLHGEAGLSRKADEPGAASYYYSFTRLQTEGLLTEPKKSIPLRGTSWFDHEFSSSTLGKDQVGWDWFALQLDSGEELMLYGLRKKDGSVDRTAGGSWVAPDGTRKGLRYGEFTFERLGAWKSPHTGARYPAGWRIRIPSLELDVEVAPRMADQELHLHALGEIAYWEGAVRVSGTRQGSPIHGVGYVELTGYAGDPLR
ncbi:Predicted secreted hydrolase [Methylacidimicrobium sp. AP8]|uniref:lipocalin-like domain-containing protein n=1 Tax=Methylacidimicrobium sp. AP8 TaxID=2730359 RepID=UPI0018C109B7|nr:lipocalin-like domain-containing protein [Methylacidimicrobium sp. AP8]CAB4243648.1 Predicted secreted hydrolase [Methylacidimicrobium sp. AP8]